MNLIHKHKKEKGFTLIEMMVALSIFSIVMTVALGALMTVIDANKKAQAIQSLMTELNFALDDITRNARVGTNYHCKRRLSSGPSLTQTHDCPEGGVLFAFEPSQGNPSSITDQYVYRFRGTSIEKSTNGGADYIEMISDNITIDKMEFFVTGSRSNDNTQPSVIIIISGTAGLQDKIQTDFDIQTTVIPRNLDI